MLTTDQDAALKRSHLDPASLPDGVSSLNATPPDSTTPLDQDPLATSGPFSALKRALIGHEVVRFLIIGCINTGFSYLLFAGFGTLYTHLFPRLSQVIVADAAVVTAWPLGVTFSFLGFKHFVFHTKGNYLKEWLRCMAVYSVTVPASLVIVGVTTKLFLMTSLPHLWAKYAAGIVNSGLIATYSYVANKKFSFKKG